MQSVWFYQLQQPMHHHTNTLKMTGPILTFKHGFEISQIVVAGRFSSTRIYFLYRREKQKVAARTFQQQYVIFNSYGVFFEIGGIIKLRRVYKNAADTKTIVCFGIRDQ